MAQVQEFLQRPLYIFNLPEGILATLQRKDNESISSADQTYDAEARSSDEAVVPSTSCALCGVLFGTVQEQRSHVKSDFHRYNLKQKMKGRQPVSEVEFEKLLEDLDESISGSDSDEYSEDDASQSKASEKEDMLAALLKKQANISTTSYQEGAQSRIKEQGAGKLPLIWFSSPLLPPNSSLGIYRAIFTNVEQEEGNDITSTIRNKQYAPIPISKAPLKDSRTGNLPTEKSPHYFLCMIGGGHFAAMAVSLSPNSSGKNAMGVEKRQASVLAHKTFHRYTTRRKQGGAQSASDAAKGAAHSAGSTLRRYNEVALTNEIRALLAEWRPLIDSAELLFVRAAGNANRRTLYGPYDGQILRHNDPRIRGFPFNTRRATQGELMRAFVELTRVKVSHIDETALAAAATKTDQAASSKPEKPPSSSTGMNKTSKEEEAAISHTTQLQSLIRRSKAPAVLSYLSSNSLTPEFVFQPSSTQHNHHAPTPLHFAASTNSPAVVLALLTKMSADPTILNGEGKTSFELAGDRATRDAFRVARAELGEKLWDWDKARILTPLTKREADKREERDRKDAEKKEADRRKAEMARLREEQAAAAKQKEQQGSSGRKGGRPLGLGAEGSGAEKREEEARGMTPEVRMRLERERRARAAEERIRRMRGVGEAS
ncbi:MAG: hypothetical protein M1839_007078 [Geoglossum umbratile]|nr:MAG: hypothetical protein M1839_007078 [Geoglossum umbratile]